MAKEIDGIDYGPLAQLLGKWIGQKGTDIAPDNQAQNDESPFTDELTFTVAGYTENAEEQQLVAVKYHHVVRKNENGLIFHDQIGHWIYEPGTNKIMHSLTIPRGVVLLAGGEYTQDGAEGIFEVEATAGSETFGIVQSPFMLEKAKTTAFKMSLKVKENELSYYELTSLEIYGKEFAHEDFSTLKRVKYDLG
ncbi:MAG: DUF1794 domain-containing protein [Sulfurovum sp.]|nr:DUF1794 domain-containing protein [Sulfurovum sp.]